MDKFKNYTLKQLDLMYKIAENSPIREEIGKEIDRRALVKKPGVVDTIKKGLLDLIEKGKGGVGQEGEVRTWSNGKKYKKTGGKWIEVAGGKGEAKPKPEGTSSPKKEEASGKTAKPSQGSAPGVDKHEVAQLTHLKAVTKTDPAKAYEIFQSLSPEGQAVVPQEVVNSLVASSHSDDKGVDYDSLGKKEGEEKKSEPKKEAKPKFNFSTDSAAFTEQVTRARNVHDNALDADMKDKAKSFLEGAKEHKSKMKDKWDKEENLSKLDTDEKVSEAFIDIKSAVMMDDYGYEDEDSEGYDEDEDAIMKQANDDFEKKYGVSFSDAADSVGKSKNSSIKNEKVKMPKSLEATNDWIDALDDAGIKYEADYERGDDTPHTIRVSTADKKAAAELNPNSKTGKAKKEERQAKQSEANETTVLDHIIKNKTDVGEYGSKIFDIAEKMGIDLSINSVMKINSKYNESKNSIKKAHPSDVLASGYFDRLEKGGKRATVGEIRKFGGRDYIKTADGWKFHGKGTGTKAQVHKKNASLEHKPGKEEKANDFAKKRGFSTGKEDKKSDSPKSKHIGDMSSNDKIKAAKELGVKGAEKMSPKELTEAVGKAIIQKHIDKFKGDQMVASATKFIDKQQAERKAAEKNLPDPKIPDVVGMVSSKPRSKSFGTLGYKPISIGQLKKDVAHTYRKQSIAIQRKKIGEAIKRYFPEEND